MAAPSFPAASITSAPVTLALTTCGCRRRHRVGQRVDVGVDERRLGHVHVQGSRPAPIVRFGSKEQLDPARFVRIHRSFLLNGDRLTRLGPATRDSYVAVLEDGTELPVSRRGYARLNELL